MPEPVIPELGVIRRRTRTYDTAAANSTDDAVQIVLQLLTPTGSMIPTLAEAEPPGDGWKLCNGQELSKAEYPTLYALFGGQYGESDVGFQLPDLRGRTVFGAGPDIDLGATGGETQLVLSEANLPSHSHNVNDPGHAHAITDPGHSHSIAVPPNGENVSAGSDVEASEGAGSTGSASTGISVNGAATGITLGNTGSGQPVNILPASIGVNWLVRT